MCLQDDQNSLLLFIVAPSGLYMMKYFSVRQNRLMLDTELKLEDFANCLNLIEYLILLSLSFQMCFDKHVAVLFAFCVILEVCFMVIPSKLPAWFTQSSIKLSPSGVYIIVEWNSPCRQLNEH